MNGVLSRAATPSAEQVDEFDRRVDEQVDVRLEKVSGYIATEKEELAKASTKLGEVVAESQSLGGGLAQAMFTRSPIASTTWSSAPTSASSTSPGASRIRRPRRSPS